MTETRKQIMELIEPFMDKTLSFGCLIHIVAEGEDESFEIRHSGIDIVVPIKNDKYLDYDSLEIPFDEIANGKSEDLEWTYRIIGHYDISAVLKYLEDKGKKRLEILEDHICMLESIGAINGSLPNKPLHLYTDQEDKELLELLQSMK